MSQLKAYREYANRKVWVPATIDENGNLCYAKQARIFSRGANPGESNYLTQKRPTKHGRRETELGTFTANRHIDVRHLRGEEAKDISLEARFLSYGKFVQMKKVDSFARAVAEAAEIVASQQNSNELAPDQETTRAEATV